jgi:hypothetical protein
MVVSEFALLKDRCHRLLSLDCHTSSRLLEQEDKIICTPLGRQLLEGLD